MHLERMGLMKLNNTSIILNHKTHRAGLTSNKQITISHKQLAKQITFDEHTKKIIQVSNNEFISFKENKGSKNFSHYYLYGLEEYTELMSFQYSFYQRVTNNIWSFTCYEDERQILYNAEKHIMFVYPMIPLPEKTLVIDNQILYPFITTKFGKKVKIYLTENLIPIMIQDSHKEEYQNICLQDGETYAEALDRTILNLKNNRSLKRVPWKK